MTTDVAPEIKVGDTAPDFTLKDQDQKDVKLSDYRGKKKCRAVFLSPRLEPGLYQRKQVSDR
ncbi:MAG: hypothetical protein KatS3mg082_0678 [Nitrospiraceae bacterium]|nr:MAG: hypothetical protein KatS3mg082_0678 [Nitrospiraceae bacterium]